MLSPIQRFGTVVCPRIELRWSNKFASVVCQRIGIRLSNKLAIKLRYSRKFSPREDSSKEDWPINSSNLSIPMCRINKANAVEKIAYSTT